MVFDVLFIIRDKLGNRNLFLSARFGNFWFIKGARPAFPFIVNNDVIYQVVKAIGQEPQKSQQAMLSSQTFSNWSDISLRSKEMKCYEQEYLSAFLVLIYSL